MAESGVTYEQTGLLTSRSSAIMGRINLNAVPPWNMGSALILASMGSPLPLLCSLFVLYIFICFYFVPCNIHLSSLSFVFLSFHQHYIGFLVTRHMPGSQPPFFIPDPGQNKEDTSIISVVVYCVYIPLSRPIQFCPLPNQNFEKSPRSCRSCGPLDPGSKWVFANFRGVKIISSKKSPVI